MTRNRNRDRNESVHDRLNRELTRDTYGDWRLWLVVLAVLVVLGLVFLPQPRTVTYATGTVTGVTTLMGEAGPIIRVGVDLGGTRVEAGTRARAATPQNGAQVCVARNVGRWTGATTYALAPRPLCETTKSTSSVD